MAVLDGFNAFVIEQLEHGVPIEHKSMFGGVGLYSNGLFFALIAHATLYFKVDDSNRPDFEAAGSSAFRPYGDERTMGYWAVPADVLEDPDRLERWTHKALAVAAAAKRTKTSKTKRARASRPR